MNMLTCAPADATRFEHGTKSYRTRTTCRLCDTSGPVKIVPMPKCQPVDNYRFPDEPELHLPEFPMDLYQCQSCGHAQLLDVVDPQLLFGNYIYTSSSSPDLDAHFTSYAATLMRRFCLDSKSLVIDIGSNDGLFLTKFALRRVRVLGVDASETVAESARTRGIPTIGSFINDQVADKILTSWGHADVVTANNVFSHADDIRRFAECVKRLMKPQGVFVFEVAYLLDLVGNKVLDYIYHEHLSQHSIRPLKQLLARLGLTLFDIDRVPTKGGSIRGYACHRGADYPVQPIVDSLIAQEQSAGLYDPKTYAALVKEFDALREKTLILLDPYCFDGKMIASYGASATATVLNRVLETDGYFSFIIDDNPSREGRLSPGAHIPVKGPHALRVERPDIVFIASWRFAKQIIERNHEYLDQGGKFVVPLPEFKVIAR